MIRNFSELASLTQDQIFRLLCEIDNGTLVIALSHDHSELLGKIHKVLSAAASQLLSRDLKNAKSVLLPEDIIEAQLKIIRLVNEEGLLLPVQ